MPPKNRAKRPASYYREYRARKKAERLKEEAGALAVVRRETPIDAEEICDWIRVVLKVPSGPLAGERFNLPDWQRDWVCAALGPDAREAGLSISRKNGKSGLIAAVLLAFLVGPANARDWRAVVASMTGELARELRDAIEATAAVSGLAHLVKVRRSPAPGHIVGKLGARVNFLAADKSTGHAIGADIAIIDEAGLLAENRRALWNALFSSISGRDGRFWAISIQGDGPMFAEMEAREGSPGLHWRKWTSDPDCELDDEQAWFSANPGIVDGIKSIEYMRHQAERASASPGNEAHFRAYDLNQPVDPGTETIVLVREYARCVRADAPPVAGDIMVGVDLGGSLSMTCAVAIAVESGAILVRGAFGDDPPLSTRARSDRMGTLYDRMVREGELRLYPGQVTPVADFLQAFFTEVGALGRVVMVGADRYRRHEASTAFRAAKLAHPRFVWRGQGASATADGSHDVRAFQRMVRDRQLVTTGSTMLESAIANSVLRYDGAGNPALDKRSNQARIDALSAAVIAAGLRELVNPLPLFSVHVV